MEAETIRSCLKMISADRLANPQNGRIRVALTSYRLAVLGSRSGLPMVRILLKPVRVWHKFFVGWILGMDIPDSARIGPGLKIQHGYGLVIHSRAQIGSGVTLRQGVTLGVKESGGRPPVLGSFVDVGSNAQILGPIAVGNGAVVGAGSIVTHDVPSMSVVAGNPARLLRMLNVTEGCE